MGLAEIIDSVEFLVDAAGNKKAAVLDWQIWEELLTLLEDLEDAEELARLKQADEEIISWEQAKAELQAEGIDV